jgi:hypothetical protein
MKTNQKLIAVILVLIGIWFFWPKGPSVEEYRAAVIAEMNRNLALSDNAVRKKIEDAHLTVTAKDASVTSCDIRTVDGSDRAGKNGSNVAEIDCVITVKWDGWIQHDGFTEFEIVYDNQTKTVKETKYLRSNALINIDTIDWSAVGYAVGQYIAAAIM